MPLERLGPFVYQRYQPHLPALEAGQEPQLHDVLIAGGGPVGLSTALGLALRGVRSVIIEADDSVCEGSRAACTSRRSLEILDRLGVSRTFLGKGLPWTTGRSYYREREVLVFSMPHDETQKFPPMINLEQYYIEQFLLDEIARVNAAAADGKPLVEMRWASKVTAFTQHAQGVRLTVENALGHYETRGRWLVATDGGQSFIRHALGLELKGAAYSGRYAIVDIELASASPTERRAWFDPPWARGTTILMHRQPDNLWRIDYQLRKHENTDESLTPEQIQAFVQRHLDAIGEGHLPWTPVWASNYRAGAMTLDAYRHGRVLFAGNSAHAMPIFGVRGLNSGFDDADNLAWKLAAVVQGQGGEALLDSYSHERVQAFHLNAEAAMRSTEFMSPPSRGFELLREAALSLAGEHPPIANLLNPRQTSALTYRGSPLSTRGEDLRAGPVEGAPLMDLRLDDASHLTDHLHRTGFTLLGFGAAAARVQVLAQGCTRDAASLPVRGVPVKDAGAASAYGAAPGAVYLVRPDGHVAARWRDPSPASLLAALRTACAR
jgi:3-(3-hydroxy-phenyl)propionate hydroxylase